MVNQPINSRHTFTTPPNGMKAYPAPPSLLSNSSPSLTPKPYPNNLSNSNGSSSSMSNNNTTPKTEAEVIVWKVFSNKTSETWDVFSNELQIALGADFSTIQRLQFVFANNGVVERTIWESFLIWFSPLDASNIYQTSGGSYDSVGGGYTIDHILSVCTPLWFHGFLSSADAQKGLKGKADGTFLFRFSTTNPGCYALTVAYSSTVGHWRISCEKKQSEQPVFLIDGRQYRSLDDIIQTHSFGREPLNIKSPKPGQAISCFLGSFHPRITDIEDNQYYQNVHVKR